MGPHLIHENLDTAYVNLAALLRYLQDREFVGRVHVELVDCVADIFLNRDGVPRVRATDHVTSETTEGEAALQHLIVRSLESGGLINVYEGGAELVGGGSLDASTNESNGHESTGEPARLTPEEAEREELVGLGGEVIAAVERAILSNGGDFAASFLSARIELADDYSFLDPTTENLEYTRPGRVRLRSNPTASVYATGISECMRRVVAKVATGELGTRVRTRVALELAILSRRRQTQLARYRFARQIDRIVGIRGR